MRKALAVVTAVFVWIVLSSGSGAPAYGQTARDEARAHFGAGEARFKAGDFRGAIGEFQTADRLVPSPMLTYNVALCFDRLGDVAVAASLYRQYLDRRPDAPNRAQVEARLAQLAPAAPLPPYEVQAPGPPAPATPPAGAPEGDQLAAPRTVPPGSRPYDDAFARRLGRVQTGDAEQAPPAGPPPPPAMGPGPDEAEASGLARGAPGPSYAGEPRPAYPGEPAPLVPVRVPDTAPRAGDRPIYTKWWFWAVVGVGTVIVIDVAAHAGAHDRGPANGLVLFHF